MNRCASIRSGNPSSSFCSAYVSLAPFGGAASLGRTVSFGFAAGLSVLYGTLAAPHTFAIDPDFTAQWRTFVVTAEYLYAARYDGTVILPGTIQQGGAIEPGLTLFDRRLGKLFVVRDPPAGRTTAERVGDVGRGRSFRAQRGRRRHRPS